MKVNVEFSGGLELLMKNKVKSITAEFVEDTVSLKAVVNWVRDNLIKERSELFVANGSVRPGILVLVNDCDWELSGGIESPVVEGDTVVFISTLHGG